MKKTELKHIEKTITNGSFFAKWKCLKILDNSCNNTSLDLLKIANEDKNPFIRRRASKIYYQHKKQLAKTKPPKKTRGIKPETIPSKPNWQEKRDKINLLCKDGSKNIAGIMKYVNDDEPVVRGIAATALKDIDYKKYLEALKILMNDPDKDIRRMAAEALEKSERKSERKTEYKKYCPHCKRYVEPKEWALPDYKYLDAPFYRYYCPYCRYEF